MKDNIYWFLLNWHIDHPRLPIWMDRIILWLREVSVKHIHQFFETNKEESFTSRETVGVWIQISSKYGVRVVCSICGEQRQVWQNGTINVYNKKKEVWERL